MELKVLVACFFLVVIIGMVYYVFSKKEIPVENKLVQNYQEIERRKKIREQVDSFLVGALFFDHMGSWGKEDIYKYISSQGRVYEFFEFMSENEQRLGIDDNVLCFKKMTYKRNDSATINMS